MAPSAGRRRLSATVLALLLCCAGGWADAQPAGVAERTSDYGTRWSDTEKWVWDLLKAGEGASLDDRCTDKNLDPTKDEKAEPHWLDACRQVTADFLYDVLTDARWKKAMPHEGVQIDAAHIVGDLDLDSAELVRQIWISNSRIDGSVILLRARTKTVIGLSGSFVRDAFVADSLNSESDLLLAGGTTFGQGVDMRSAKVAGQVTLDGASVVGTLNANVLQAGNLLMRSDDKHQASFQDVILTNAKIAGVVSLVGASVSALLDGNSLQAGHLYMSSDDKYQANFKDVILRGAKVSGGVELVGASVTGMLDAAALQTAGNLLMVSDDKHQASFKDVLLFGAKVAGQVDMDGANVTGNFNGETLQVGQTLFMRSTHVAGSGKQRIASFPGGIRLIFARITGSLDLRGAALTVVDLSGAAVDGEFRLGSSGGRVTTWNDTNGKPASMVLRDTRIGSLADEQAVWQVDGTSRRPALQLDGVTISHLGGIASGTAVQMRDRGMAWWDAWARLDPQYSPAPYTQLANAFAEMGDRDDANEIRFRGRVRERDAMTGWPWFAATALQYVAGFGIGGYTFRVLYWIAGFTTAGAVLLWLTVPAARTEHRGSIWCFGASLSRLLPIIEINKEFTDFFDDPGRTRLNGWQAVAFSVLGAVGWVLGGILIAAVSGLTQNP